jgi:hypothetical protein
MKEVDQLIAYNGAYDIREVARYSATIRLIYRAIVDIAQTLTDHHHVTDEELLAIRHIAKRFIAEYSQENGTITEDQIADVVVKSYRAIETLYKRERCIERETVKTALENIIRHIE